MSARPGTRVRPSPSIRMASSGTSISARGPIATIRPSRTTTVWAGSTPPSTVIGTTSTPTKAWAGGAGSGERRIRSVSSSRSTVPGIAVSISTPSPASCSRPNVHRPGETGVTAAPSSDRRGRSSRWKVTRRRSPSRVSSRTSRSRSARRNPGSVPRVSAYVTKAPRTRRPRSTTHRSSREERLRARSLSGSSTITFRPGRASNSDRAASKLARCASTRSRLAARSSSQPSRSMAVRRTASRPPSSGSSAASSQSWRLRLVPASSTPRFQPGAKASRRRPSAAPTG